MFNITADELNFVKEGFLLRGESIADWARLHNFNAATVYSVLNGRIKCKRGEAHQIAVKLGLKPSTATALVSHGNPEVK